MKIKTLFVLTLLIFAAATVLADQFDLDYPHNATNTINCWSCHYYTNNPAEWAKHSPQDIDDTPWNSLCWSCHNDTDAAYAKTHSSLAASTQYGEWTLECKTCHWPHQQSQLRTYGAEAYLYTATTGQAAADTLTRSGGAAWQPDAYAGYLVIPNLNQRSYNYKIVSNTEDTLTVQGPINLGKVTPGSDTMAIIYGRLIRESITTPASGQKTVRFFQNTGPHSFADGDATFDGICEVCHTQVGHFKNNGSAAEQNHENLGGEQGTDCIYCHKHDGFGHGGGVGCDTAIECHGTHASHLIHTGSMVGIVCSDCHDTDDFPKLSDGQDLANTTACNACHSADGAVFARQYFYTAGTWKAAVGEVSFCGSCHDASPGNNQADGGGAAAQNILGNSSTYGYTVTGHGKTSGNYTRLSWQDTAATGNPAANQACSACHDLTSQHFDNAGKRLKAGFANDQDNTNCNNCHTSTGDDPDPDYYTTSADYENSAHGGKMCTDCHDVHGTTAPAMTTAAQESLCYQCHTQGMIQNVSISAQKGNHDGADNAVTLTDATQSWTVNELAGKTILNLTDNSSGTITANSATTITATLSGGTDNDWDSGDTYVYSLVADDIQEAFGLAESHNLDTAFEVGGSNYTLQCVSCHNVHLITGRYWQAASGKTPVTRFPPGDAANLEPWGDDGTEKMATYAGSGTYRTSNSDIFSGTELPDYATFCLDCHADSNGHANFNINWTSRPHGKGAASMPNGYGTCPDWWTCGKASGWDGDDCVAADPDDCWPVMTRGMGDQLWSRGAYDHEDRIAGANFTLSCSDCHEAHGSGVSSMLRTNPNNGSGSSNWGTMCNNCHYYYSDWHAGMSCGNASCHTENSIHRMGAYSGSGATRSFDPDLVLYYGFNNNLNDSGTWSMHGKWYDNTGSYTTGKSGQAVVLSGTHTVQVGTRNASWTTDEGAHGTWKYTEMKYNTSQEAWVYPTDAANSEYSIFTKHVGYNSGGYAFSLQKIGGSLRAVFNMQADSNGTTQGGAAGIRGAYSSVAVPLNTWTHVAATFDPTGPDRDPADPAVGRIRIYVNGEDVTTSSESGNTMQPGANETSIFAFSENSPWNQAGVCFEDTWCASEFSIGGFHGWQNAFIGRLDEAKVWNITKNAAYFSTYDSQAGPFISSITGNIGSSQLTVTFSEGVYTAAGASGALTATDFVFTDTDNGRTITGVSHTAGYSNAVLTLSSALDGSDDLNSDTLAAAGSAIYDEYDNAAGTAAVAIVASGACPEGLVTFDLNETPGTAYVTDNQSLLAGAVANSLTALTGSAFSSDGVGNYINFSNNDTCLQADRKLTVEARIRPTGIGTANYVTRVLARDGGGNYQLSVWRNNGWTTYNAPDNTASIALWTYPLPTVGSTWKPVLTDYDACPITNDHWYLVKAVWDSDRVGSMPGRIYVDDQGTDGAGAGENWSGYTDCTNLNQTYNDPATQIIAEGDYLKKVDSNFAIGANRGNLANNVFNGLIDWITWQDAVQ